MTRPMIFGVLIWGCFLELNWGVWVLFAIGIGIGKEKVPRSNAPRGTQYLSSNHRFEQRSALI